MCDTIRRIHGRQEPELVHAAEAQRPLLSRSSCVFPKWAKTKYTIAFYMCKQRKPGNGSRVLLRASLHDLEDPGYPGRAPSHSSRFNRHSCARPLGAAHQTNLRQFVHRAGRFVFFLPFVSSRRSMDNHSSFARLVVFEALGKVEYAARLPSSKHKLTASAWKHAHNCFFQCPSAKSQLLSDTCV